MAAVRRGSEAEHEAAIRVEAAEARAEAAEAAAAAAEEAARQKAECITWGVGSFQCPRKYCEPKETMHNMDALFDGKVCCEGRNP